MIIVDENIAGGIPGLQIYDPDRQSGVLIEWGQIEGVIDILRAKLTKYRRQHDRCDACGESFEGPPAESLCESCWNDRRDEQRGSEHG